MGMLSAFDTPSTSCSSGELVAPGAVVGSLCLNLILMFRRKRPAGVIAKANGNTCECRIS